jgi:hypothetical protein
MKTNKPFIIKLSNSQEMKIYWNEWDQKWEGHVSYLFNLDKLNDPVIGVNAIANAVGKSAKGNHYGLVLDNLMLTISIYDFKSEV